MRLCSENLVESQCQAVVSVKCSQLTPCSVHKKPSELSEFIMRIIHPCKINCEARPSTRRATLSLTYKLALQHSPTNSNLFDLTFSHFVFVHSSHRRASHPYSMAYGLKSTALKQRTDTKQKKKRKTRIACGVSSSASERALARACTPSNSYIIYHFTQNNFILFLFFLPPFDTICP